MKSWIVPFLALLLTVSAQAGLERPAARPSPAPAARTVLLVDDDGGHDHQSPYVQELSRPGWTLTTWDASVQGSPSDGTVGTPDLVVWVTGGGWNDLSPQETRSLEVRIRRGASTLVAGKYTGRALSWGFLDRQLFGLEYRDTTFFPEAIGPADGFPSSTRVATDHALLTGGEALWALRGPNGSDPGTIGHAVVVRHWAWGSRTAWIGFDLRDVWSTYDQSRILRDVLWYVSFKASDAIEQLADPGIPADRRDFLMGELRQDMVREGTGGGPVTQAVAGSALPALKALHSRVRLFLQPATETR